MSFSLDQYRAKTDGFGAGDLASRYGIGLGPVGQYGFRAARQAWQNVFAKRLVDASDDQNPLFAVPQPLGAEHVAGCRVFANRLAMIDTVPKGGVWAEIGTWEGVFAREIANRCAPSKLHLFDIDFGRTRKLGLIEESPSVTFHEGKSAEMLATFEDGHFDAIYIDGDHTLIGVARDAKVALQKIKPDGRLIFNDYILFSHLELFPYGTVPVVNSLCNDHGWEIEGLAMHPKMFCDVMLRRRAD